MGLDIWSKHIKKLITSKSYDVINKIVYYTYNHIYSAVYSFISEYVNYSNKQLNMNLKNIKLEIDAISNFIGSMDRWLTG